MCNQIELNFIVAFLYCDNTSSSLFTLPPVANDINVFQTFVLINKKKTQTSIHHLLSFGSTTSGCPKTMAVVVKQQAMTSN